MSPPEDCIGENTTLLAQKYFKWIFDNFFSLFFAHWPSTTSKTTNVEKKKPTCRFSFYELKRKSFKWVNMFPVWAVMHSTDSGGLSECPEIMSLRLPMVSTGWGPVSPYKILLIVDLIHIWRKIKHLSTCGHSKFVWDLRGFVLFSKKVCLSAYLLLLQVWWLIPGHLMNLQFQ